MARCRRRDRRRVDCRPRRVRRRRGGGRDRAVRRPRLRRRAHAPRVLEAAPGRVRASRAAARDHRRRRRPTRDRQRPRDGRRALAARRVGRHPARRLLHGFVVRSGVGVRVAAACADGGRPRGAAPPPARARSRRDDELPGRGLRGRGGAREACARHARRRSRARRPRHAPCRLTRPRAFAQITRRRRSTRDASGCAPACGCSCARRPPRATCARCCRSSRNTDRIASRSAPTIASRSTSPRTGTSTRWCATPSTSASRPRTRWSWRHTTRRTTTGSTTSARSLPGVRPTSSCSVTSSGSCRSSC